MEFGILKLGLGFFASFIYVIPLFEVAVHTLENATMHC